MDWDAVGAVGEIVGAIAVVVSVIYLALQIKKQTDESRLAASRDLSAQFNDAIGAVTADIDQTEIYLKAVRDYNSLPDKERIWVSLVFQRYCRLMEQQHIHLSQGNVDPVYFESVEVGWQEWMTFPGSQQWWEQSKGMFGANFQKYVDGLMDEAKKKEHDSSFARKVDQRASSAARSEEST